VIEPPSRVAESAARERLAALAKPTGALGRVEDLAAWLAACQGACPPKPPSRVRLVVLAGDHGVAARGVSAYPAEVTAAMVHAFATGTAAAGVLARQHGVALRVLDIAVDADLVDPPGVGAYKIRRGSGSIDVEDALSEAELDAALLAGWAIAREEIAAGADLLILGDMGIGNTTPAAALIATTFGMPAADVVGRGTGIDDDALARKTAVLEAAVDRVGDRARDPRTRLRALGSADLATGVGFLIAAAQEGVPVLLDGLATLAELSMADEIAPGTAAWCAAGHRSTEPAQRLALDKLGLVPVLDLGLRLGEGSGALLALPVLRSAAELTGEMALLTDLV
jgi:nicotinate-nucleotide--dimethylbenzimidazole phosphoribosyltransferase